jgi:hypothetical protein
MTSCAKTGGTCTNGITAPAMLSEMSQASVQVADHLTAQQRAARQTFDLDRAMALLPDLPKSMPTVKGSAGVRLSKHLRATLSEDLLREFAKEQLKAVRLTAKYLEALRIVLGNQADAERKCHVLEMNIRVDFASERVMRNIIDQMSLAGITTGRQVSLGKGRTQLVQCYVLPDAEPCQRRFGDINELLRVEEDALEDGRKAKVWSAEAVPTFNEADIPF